MGVNFGGGGFDWGRLLNRSGGQQQPAAQGAPPPIPGLHPQIPRNQAGFRQNYDYFNRQGDFGGWNNKLKATVDPALASLYSGTAITAPTAYSGLAELLSRNGKIDPAAMNLQLSDISRSTQNAQMQAGGHAAGSLNQGSGVAQAIQASIGQGGLDRRAGVMADEAKEAENRRRADLMLFYQMVMDPAMQLQGVERSANAAEGQGGNAWSEISKLLGVGLTTGASLSKKSATGGVV